MDISSKKGGALLTLGALGIVFGDIGTSPLYALSALFGPVGARLAITEANVFGIISLIIWSITIVVSIKYIGFIMAADNKGEGGIMALVAEVQSAMKRGHSLWPFTLLGLVGVSLFYGDSTITPAISVLSAVEGLKIVAPHLESLIVPATLAILAALFSIQKYGTSFIARFFGPIMFLWFACIGLGGAHQILKHPGILASLSPLEAFRFFIDQPSIALIAMGAIVLVITGAEALYADMGHFGRKPIAKAWFLVVFPSLLLCYMGQGALLLHTSGTASSPLLLLYPGVARIPVLVLATLATIIASQSVISGAFSLTRQAIQLNVLPKMKILHTSASESGQIYVPFVNLALFIVVSLLVLLFGSSGKLASAYGIAVSATLAADTILYLVVLRTSWHIPMYRVVAASLIFLPLDLLFVTATVPKVLQGGWFPLLIASFVFLVITTWVKGQVIVTGERKSMEGSLKDFITKIHAMRPALPRIPGTAIFIGHHAGSAPLALHATVEDLHELPATVVVVLVETASVSHIAEEKRATFDSLGQDDGISYVTLTYGFHDSPNIPRALENLAESHPEVKEIQLDLEHASYFVSMSRVVPDRGHRLAFWRKSLYTIMAHNATSSSDYYKLPIERTVEMQSLIPL